MRLASWTNNVGAHLVLETFDAYAPPPDGVVNRWVLRDRAEFVARRLEGLKGTYSMTRRGSEYHYQPSGSRTIVLYIEQANELGRVEL